MRRLFSFFVVLSLSTFFSQFANAATISPSTVKDCDAHLQGQIAPGDVEQLAAFADKFENKSDGFTLCLNSPGGSLAEGKRLFDEIWSSNIATRVVKGERCESACAIAFLGGSKSLGTGVVRVQARFLDAGARLGFHAPSLTLPPGNTYPAEDVNKAFEIALKSAESFFSIKLSEEHNVHAMTDFLYQRILTTRPQSMFFIKSVGDAVLSNITLKGLPLPGSAGKAEFKNICDNAWAATQIGGKPGFNSAEEYYRDIEDNARDERRVKLVRDGDSTTGKVYGYYHLSNGYAHGCIASLSDSWKDDVSHLQEDYEDYGDQDIEVSFVSYYTPDGIGNLRSSEITRVVSVPYWYMLNPNVKIENGETRAQMPPSPPIETAAREKKSMNYAPEIFKLFAGYDLFGGDLARGTVRGISSDTCQETCRSHGRCDAVTYDRWNHICFLKTAANSRHMLSLQSKADTYVLAGAANSLQKLVEPELGKETVTRKGKAFRDKPDAVHKTENVDNCAKLTRQREALAFNWYPHERTCEIFQDPNEYFTQSKATAGYFQQPTQN